MKASCGLPPGGVPDMIGLSVVSVVAHGGSLPARGGHSVACVFHAPLVRHRTSPLVVSMHGGSILGTKELSWKFPLALGLVVVCQRTCGWLVVALVLHQWVLQVLLGAWLEDFSCSLPSLAACSWT